MKCGYYLDNGAKIREACDGSFSEYGRLIELPSEEAVDYIQLNAAIPEEGNLYLADNETFRELPVIKDIRRQIFGELDIESGWCTGRLAKMNAMEWHKSSEVIIAATDMVLLLGRYCDIIDGVYDSEAASAYLLKKGCIAELYPMVLHFAPLNVGSGFKAGIVLPAKTNLALDGGIEGTLRAKNKWLLVHPEFEKGIKTGGKVGIFGHNIELQHEKV